MFYRRHKKDVIRSTIEFKSLMEQGVLCSGALLSSNTKCLQLTHSSFRFKDLTKILPSYVELRAEHFPLAKLPTAQLSPVNVLPQPPQPVMAAQANFIEGGLLLTIAVHHSVCDGSGVDTIMDNWANNTAALGKGASFTQHDHPSNDRSRLMTGNPGANLANYPEYILTPSPRGTSTDVNTHQMAEMPFQLPPMTAHIFYFSPESLAVLKHSAASHSTNDALMAFTWKHMTLARNPPSSTKISSSDEDKTSALLFAANIRDSTSPPLPVTYLGNASMAVITERLLVSTLTSNSGLAQAAAAIRTSITALKTPDRVSLTIGLLNSRPDPTDFKFAYNAFLGPDVSATSWAKFGIYERSWGVLGKPESFRIPGEGADGVIIVFPQLNEGGLEVMIGLENSSVKRLLANGEFAKAATLWG